MNSDSELPDPDAAIERFSGSAPVFPLPGVVLFPHLAIPLHIFEPRYRQMVEDALDSDRLIAMALPAPGWESEYEGRPAVHPIVCLGEIVSHERMPDGRFNLILRGVSRGKITSELVTGKLYRTMTLDLFPDEPDDDETESTSNESMSEQLVAAFRETQPARELTDVLKGILSAGLPTGLLCDFLANALRMSSEEKQAILSELDIARRCKLVLKHIRKRKSVSKPKPPSRRFPPEFSVN